MARMIIPFVVLSALASAAGAQPASKPVMIEMGELRLGDGDAGLVEFGPDAGTSHPPTRPATTQADEEAFTVLVIGSKHGAASHPTSRTSTTQADEIPFEELLAQTAEAKALMDVEELTNAVELSRDQSRKIADDLRELSEGMAKIMETRKDEWAALMRTEAEIEESVRTMGGRNSTRMILAKRQRHEKLWRDVIALHQTYIKAVMRDMTAEQRLRWCSQGIRAEFDEQGLANVTLSPEQRKQIADICSAAGRDIVSLGDIPRLRQRDAISARAFRECRTTVLTREQRKQLGFPWADEN